ncbi:hypothetical protein [Vibrio harveyi]|uniref:hypothetical protein n=1 Tax=Vibrio harveyi TaxID=669 RepID=UPI003AAA2764
MPASVFFLNDFYNGQHRCKKFSDFGKMTPQEVTHLYNFIDRVKGGRKIYTKNKESWLRDDGTVIKKRQGYKGCKLWHAHSRRIPNNPARRRGKQVRLRNTKGYTSAAVVHYKWLDPAIQKKLLIIAFSPSHNPFPVPRTQGNILDNRSGIVRNISINTTKM